MFESVDLSDWIVDMLLNKDETFEAKEGKTTVSREDKLKDLYNAIFVNRYDGRKYCENIGSYCFDANSKGFIIRAAGLMSGYANLKF